LGAPSGGWVFAGHEGVESLIVRPILSAMAAPPQSVSFA
jgi:hypothetical protein